MYSIYDVVAIGSLLLIIYVILDFMRNKTKNIIRRLIFYSFIFYLLYVVQVTTGGIVYPPQDNPVPFLVQLVPFYFVADWLSIYRNNGLDWFFWNSVKLSFYNFIMLMPFGVYLSLLFKPRGILNSIFIIFLMSLTIETSQIFFGYLGIVRGREFDVDDLILNTLGGFIAFFIVDLLKRYIASLQISTTKKRSKFIKLVRL